jgi:limonene-1,2-epoxide hydrolase
MTADAVTRYTNLLASLVPAATTPEGWRPLADLVAVDEFERHGTFLEVHDWDGYVEMLSRWARSVDRFETTVHRITEAGRLVFYEIEERHFRGDEVDVVNSMTVFEFDDTDRIRRLDVYLQQPTR